MNNAKFETKLKKLAKQQTIYAKKLNRINMEIEKILNDNNIFSENLNKIYLLTEPEILEDYLYKIANNYKNEKKLTLDVCYRKNTYSDIY